MGFDTDVFAESFGGRKPVQLAIDGSSCVPVLNHLSHDGLLTRAWSYATCFPARFLGCQLERWKTGRISASLRTAVCPASIEQALRIWVQSHLVIRLPEVSVGRLLDELRRFRLPEQSYVVTTPDRNRRADYSKVDIAPLIDSIARNRPSCSRRRVTRSICAGSRAAQGHRIPNPKSWQTRLFCTPAGQRRRCARSRTSYSLAESIGMHWGRAQGH